MERNEREGVSYTVLGSDFHVYNPSAIIYSTRNGGLGGGMGDQIPVVVVMPPNFGILFQC
eukprot:2621243-Rhodomonas_salina.1